MLRRRSRAAVTAALVLAVGAGAQTSAGAAATGLAIPAKKEIAMRLVSSAENSSLDWRSQYRYIEDIHDGRGYTAGIIGFCSGTGYFKPAVALAKSDGLRSLGQFAYYDAAVVHGFDGMRGVRERALARAATPAAGAAYLEAFLDERVVEMHKEAAHDDVSRIETAQRRFLREGNLDLAPPLRWAVYGDRYSITR
ncbi:MAG: chitosanase [Solirubrobacteraceae bacterium]